MTDTTPRRPRSRTRRCRWSSSPSWWSARSSARTGSPPRVADRSAATACWAPLQAAAPGGRRPGRRCPTPACACCGSGAPTENGVTGDPVEGTAVRRGRRAEDRGRRDQRRTRPTSSSSRPAFPPRSPSARPRAARQVVQSADLGFSEDLSAGPKTVKLAALRAGHVRVLVRHADGLRPDRRRVGAGDDSRPTSSRQVIRMHPLISESVVRLRVEGMRCHSCEQVLTAWLSDIRGVEAVVANHTSGQVVIYADPDVPVDAMLKAVIHAGFVPGEPTVLIGTDAAPRSRCRSRPIEPTSATWSSYSRRASCPIVAEVRRGGCPPSPSPAGARPTHRRVVPAPQAERARTCTAVRARSSSPRHALEVPGVAAAVGDAADHAVTVYLDGEVPLDDLAAAVVAAGFTPGKPFVRGMALVPELPGAEPEAVERRADQAVPGAASTRPGHALRSLPRSRFATMQARRSPACRRDRSTRSPKP